ncbi:MAG: hypothetical protein WBD34_22685 [Burkholderiaceae bacterium]
MKILLVACWTLFLVGCGITSGPLGDLPSVPNKEIASKITVVRISSFAGALNGFTVALDGKDIFGIGSGEYAEFFVPKGEHVITVKCFGGWTPTWKEDSLEFVAKPSEDNFFVIFANFSPNFNPNLKCAGIGMSNETEIKIYIESSKRIDLEKPSR